MLEALKARLPRSLKRAVRQMLLDPLDQQMHERRLRQVVRDYRARPTSDRALVERFRDAWGNPAFTADATYVGELLTRVARCGGPVLECGSGLTTIVAALVGEGRGLTIWSLEQDAAWARCVAHRLAMNDIGNVVLRHAPLRDYGGYVWYDVDGMQLPEHFDLVLCDGPAEFDAAGDAYPLWRYGLLPVLAARGITVGEILLDDATTRGAPPVLQRWRHEFGMVHELIRSADGVCAVLRAGVRPAP